MHGVLPVIASRWPRCTVLKINAPRAILVLHAISLTIALMSVWLLLSGIYTPMLIALGALSSVIVVAIALRMDVIDHEAVPVHLSWRIVPYWAWLFVEIVKANIDVARRVLAPSMPIHPTIVRINAKQKSEFGQVIFANSITLTPGTVSIDVVGGTIVVHALSREGADALREGTMNRKVAAIEGQA